MISEESLFLEREERINKFKDKLNKKLVLTKEKYRENINSECAEYSLRHTDEETDIHRAYLEEVARDKLADMEAKHSKKIAKYTKKLEWRSKDVLSTSKRIWEIDVLRGIAIWGMIFDHYVYDFYEIFAGNSGIISDYDHGWLFELHKFASAYWVNDFRIFVRLFGVFLFVFLCGISCKFAKNNVKRGLQITGLGLVITGALYIASLVTGDSSFHVLLSTLTTIGLCILIYTGVSTLFKKMCGEKNWKWICLGITVALFVFWGIFAGYNYTHNSNMPWHDNDMLFKRFFYVFNNNGNDIGWVGGYQNINIDNWWKFVLGTQGFGADWLGLFPYVGYIFLGGFVGETLYADKKSIIKYFYPKEERKLTGAAYLATRQGQLNAKLNLRLGGISYPGKHTLFVYILHQPVAIIIIVPILLLFGYHLTFFA